MNVLSFLSVMACFSYFGLGLYIYLFNRHAALNRTFFHFSLIFSIYAFAYAFYYVAPTREDAILWYKISAVGWTLFPAFLLNFILLLTKTNIKRRRWWLYPVIFMPGLIFLYLAITTHFYAAGFIFNGNHWTIIPNEGSAVFWIYLAYLFFYIVLGFLLVVRWRQKTQINKERKQADILIGIFIIITILNTMSNVVIPMIYPTAFPDVAHILSLILFFGIGYAIIRYRLMMITPQSTASLLLSRMNEYLFFTDDAGRIIRANDFTVHNLGYSENELKQKQFASLTGEQPFDLEDHSTDPGSPGAERFRTHLTRREGGSIPVSMICTRILDKYNDRLGYVIVGYDTTYEDRLNEEIEERKNIEFELIRAKEKVEESDKLKSTFLANVSHELRTPLNGILGFTEILKMDVDDPVIGEIVDYIDQSGNRLLGTLNSLIDLSLIETNKHEIDKQLVNVAELVRQKTDLFKSYISSKNLTFETQLRGEILKARTDPRLLGHVINNLLDNAIKYTEEGGITVSLDNERVGHRLFLVIAVKDTGIGIDPSHYNRIFESFRQISEGYDREYEGIGIGLSICKNFVEMLDGEIWVDSTLGEGSTFHVRIPAWQDAVIANPEKSSGEKSIKKTFPGNDKPYLLIVEDEKTNREYMRFTLSQHFEVDVAINGFKALEMVQKQKYDAIFMDVNLGKEMSGMQAMKKIRKLDGYQNVPVAAVTANVMKAQQDTFLRNGFTHYLPKPFKRQQLIDLARYMISGSNR